MTGQLKVLVDVDALDVHPLSGQKRTAVLGFIRSLIDHGHRYGDMQKRDPETGRTFEVSFVAGFAITWWLDPPVNEVKVVDITAIK